MDKDKKMDKGRKIDFHIPMKMPPAVLWDTKIIPAGEEVGYTRFFRNPSEKANIETNGYLLGQSVDMKGIGLFVHRDTNSEFVKTLYQNASLDFSIGKFYVRGFLPILNTYEPEGSEKELVPIFYTPVVTKTLMGLNCIKGKFRVILDTEEKKIYKFIPEEPVKTISEKEHLEMNDPKGLIEAVRSCLHIPEKQDFFVDIYHGSFYPSPLDLLQDQEIWCTIHGTLHRHSPVIDHLRKSKRKDRNDDT